MNTQSEQKDGPNWDPIVRVTHWGVALAVLLNGLITEDGGQIHVWVGYAALALLVLRLVWGFLGTEEARFSSFPPSIKGAKSHFSDVLAGRHQSHKSHNPVGALMAYALWGTLLIVTATGIAMHGSPFVSPTAQVADPNPVVYYVSDNGYKHHDDDEYESHDSEEVMEEIHEFFANLLLILAACHVGGVAFESMLSRRNLVRAMISGTTEPRSH
jgi:cytochrome b